MKNQLVKNGILLCLMIFIQTFGQLRAQENIALGKTVTASTAESGNPASNATDGNTSTRWGSSGDAGNWIYVDLGGNYDIDSAQLVLETGNNNQFKVETSADLTTWTTAVDSAASTYSSTTETVVFSSLAQRYVRFTFTTAWPSLFELRIFGAQTNIALNKTVTANTAEGPNPASNATDGDINTRWGSSGDAGNWIYVDLGGNFDITGAQLFLETGNNNKFKIETSTDKITWNVALDSTASIYSAQTETVAFSSLAQRYVRFTFATGWPSLYELRIFGTLSSGLETEPPSVPTNLAFSDLNQASFTLSWTASTDNVGVTSYEIFDGGVSLGTSTSNSKLLNGFTCNSAHSITVKAGDAAGNWSIASNVFIVTTADCTPNILVNAGFEDGAIGWTQWGTLNLNTTEQRSGANCSEVATGTALQQPVNEGFTAGTEYIFSAWFKFAAAYTGGGTLFYQAYNKDELIDKVYLPFPTSIGTTYTQVNINFILPANTTQIRCSYENGTNQIMYVDDAYLGEVVAADTEAPSAPTDLVPSNINKRSFNLSWTAASDNVGVTGYEVFNDGVSVGTTANTSMSITGLACETAYTIKVKATDAAGNWSDADSLSVTTSACTAATNLIVNPGFESDLTTGWTIDWGGIQSSTYANTGTYSCAVGPSSGGRAQDITSGFIIGYQYTLSAYCRLSGSGTGNLMGYVTLDASQNVINSHFNAISNTTAFEQSSITFTVDTGTSIIRIYALNNDGNTTLYCDDYQLSLVDDISAPSVPTNLESGDITKTGFTLTWVGSTDNYGVTGYEVFKDGFSVGTTANKAMNITGLTCETEYSMTVRATDEAGNLSEESEALSVSTADCTDDTPPTAPTLSSSALALTSFTLSWSGSTDNVGVTGYEVFKDGNSVGTTTSSSLSVTGLTCGTAYIMTVKATDAAGNWSDVSIALIVNTMNCSNVSTEDISATEGVSVYPNPANTNITISNIEPNSNISIYSLDGKVIYTGKQLNISDLNLSIRGWNKGIYFLKVESKRGMVVKKVIVE